MADIKGNREKIHRIMDMVMDTNGLSERKKALTGNAPTVMCDFSGHVACLSIRLYNEGWTNDAKPSFSLDIYTDVDIKPSVMDMLDKVFKEAVAC